MACSAGVSPTGVEAPVKICRIGVTFLFRWAWCTHEWPVLLGLWGVRVRTLSAALESFEFLASLTSEGFGNALHLFPFPPPCAPLLFLSTLRLCLES